ncbi:MAG: DMT family transporter [Paracoccaceae bacterium]
MSQPIPPTAPLPISSVSRTRGLAIAFMLGAGALVAATSLIAKTLGLADSSHAAIPAFQVSAGRFGFAFLTLCAFLLVRRQRPPSLHKAHWRWHLARSLCGWLGVTAMFSAVAHMPLAEATAISFLNPLVTMGLAVLLLDERLTTRRILAAGLSLMGALLILRPGTDAFQMAGLLALTAACLFGLEAIFIKRLSDTEPALRVLLINNAIGATVSISIATLVWVWPTPGQWGLLIALGAIMVCGQAMFVQAMKRGEASFVMPAFYGVLVFAALYDFALFGVVPAALAIAGAGCILGGAVLLALPQRRA